MQQKSLEMRPAMPWKTVKSLWVLHSFENISNYPIMQCRVWYAVSRPLHCQKIIYSLGFSQNNQHHNIWHHQIDQMDDRANKAYASLPERLYVVKDGQVVFQVTVAIMSIVHAQFGVYPRVVWAHLTTGSVTLKTSWKRQDNQRRTHLKKGS